MIISAKFQSTQLINEIIIFTLRKIRTRIEQNEENHIFFKVQVYNYI